MATTETRKNGHIETTQDLPGKDGGRTEINLEMAEGRTELMIETHVGENDDTWATASLSREELWEHVHNCIGMLHQMTKEAGK